MMTPMETMELSESTHASAEEYVIGGTVLVF